MTLEISLLPLQRLSIHPRTRETTQNKTPQTKSQNPTPSIFKSPTLIKPCARYQQEMERGLERQLRVPMPRAKTEGEKLPETFLPLAKLQVTFLKKKIRRGQQQQKRSICLGAIKVVSHLLDSPPRRNPESKKRNSHPVCTVLHPNARRQGCQDFPRA